VLCSHFKTIRVIWNALSKRVEMTHTHCVEQFCKREACWNKTQHPCHFPSDSDSSENVSCVTWRGSSLCLSVCVHSFSSKTGLSADIQVINCLLASFAFQVRQCVTKCVCVLYIECLLYFYINLKNISLFPSTCFYANFGISEDVIGW